MCQISWQETKGKRERGGGGRLPKQIRRKKKENSGTDPRVLDFFMERDPV